jgi:4-amino-4-deoxy-L-arabinose transferase-like glycosyltransferase
MSAKSTKKVSLWIAVLLILIAGIVRLVVAVTSLDSLQSDPDAYAAIAVQLAEQGQYARADADGSTRVTAFRPPAYPVLLSLFVTGGKVNGYAVAVLHLILGWATMGVCYFAGRDWFAILVTGKEESNHLPSQQLLAGGIAAALCGIDPLLLNQARVVMTETLATFLAAVILFAAGRAYLKSVGGSYSFRWAIIGGLSFSVAMVCRPIFLIWFGICLLFLVANIWRVRKVSLWKHAAGATVLFAGLAMLLPACWLVRNVLVMQRPIVATTHGGYTFALGNNESFFNYLQGEDQIESPTWDATSWQQRLATVANSRGVQGDEIAENKLAYELARQDIAEEPKMFAWAIGIRIGRLWSPLPHATSNDESLRQRMLRFLVAGYYVSFGVAFCIALLRLRPKLSKFPLTLAFALLLATTLVHSIYWSNIRMRAPLLPILVCVVATGLVSRHDCRRTPDSASA